MVLVDNEQVKYELVEAMKNEIPVLIELKRLKKHFMRNSYIDEMNYLRCIAVLMKSHNYESDEVNELYELVELPFTFKRSVRVPRIARIVALLEKIKKQL